MAKRKLKTNTLTKIDPSVLKPKPLAVSHHATDSGIRVTTALNPVRPPLATPLLEPDIFDADPSNFAEEGSDFCDSDGDVSKGYFTAQVSRLYSFECTGSTQG